MKLFISYSHRDEWAVERLHAHLSMLKREGIISAWYDRDLTGGDDLDTEVMKNLEESQLFVAMASPDFINSDYCYSVEMKRALERNDSGEMRVLPVIVEPCEWKKSPLGKLLAVPRDGKEISNHMNKNNAFLEITQAIRKIAEAGSATPALEGRNSDRQPQTNSKLRDSQALQRFRVRKNFDALDVLEFRDEAFRRIHLYLSEAADEDLKH